MGKIGAAVVSSLFSSSPAWYHFHPFPHWVYRQLKHGCPCLFLARVRAGPKAVLGWS